MTTLAAPVYIATDAAAIVQEMVVQWQDMTGKKVYPGQIEQLLFNNLAYREVLLRSAVDQAARQNLVRFATGAILDYLGDLIGTPRLPLQACRTRLRWTLHDAALTLTQIDAGTQVQTGDGQVTFATDIDVQIAPGALTADVDASCIDAGAAGNGYGLDTINVPLSVFDADVTNLTISSDGASAESDDAYRARLLIAPAGFSVAGPSDAYVALAKSVHQSVIAVAPVSPAPCEVNVYVLTATGAPDQVLIDQIAARLSAMDARPLGILVRVLAAPTVPYRIAARLTLAGNAAPDVVLAAAQARLHALLYDGEGPDNARLDGRQHRLGVDIVPSQLASVIAGAGIYDVILDQPAAATVVQSFEWATCTGIDLTVIGAAHG